MSAPQVGDVITTTEQLEVLPAWAGVVDGGGHPWVKFPEHGDWVCPEGDLMGPWLILEECDKPLIVASLPARPERVVKAESLREAAALVDAECPHEPDEHAEGSCDLCDFTFAVTAQINERADSVEAGETR